MQEEGLKNSVVYFVRCDNYELLRTENFGLGPEVQTFKESIGNLTFENFG